MHDDMYNFIASRCILTPQNAFVDEINEHVLTKIVPGQSTKYYSADA